MTLARHWNRTWRDMVTDYVETRNNCLEIISNYVVVIKIMCLWCKHTANCVSQNNRFCFCFCLLHVFIYTLFCIFFLRRIVPRLETMHHINVHSSSSSSLQWCGHDYNYMHVITISCTWLQYHARNYSYILMTLVGRHS